LLPPARAVVRRSSRLIRPKISAGSLTGGRPMA
jgi:hypothetical protein